MSKHGYLLSDHYHFHPLHCHGDISFPSVKKASNRRQLSYKGGVKGHVPPTSTDWAIGSRVSPVYIYKEGERGKRSWKQHSWTGNVGTVLFSSRSEDRRHRGGMELVNLALLFPILYLCFSGMARL
jgi:hypothetical protein